MAQYQVTIDGEILQQLFVRGQRFRKSGRPLFWSGRT